MCARWAPLSMERIADVTQKRMERKQIKQRNPFHFLINYIYFLSQPVLWTHYSIVMKNICVRKLTNKNLNNRTDRKSLSAMLIWIEAEVIPSGIRLGSFGSEKYLLTWKLSHKQQRATSAISGKFLFRYCISSESYVFLLSWKRQTK